MLEASVDRLGGSVAGTGAIEVGEDVGGTALRCPSELAHLDERRWHTVRERLDQRGPEHGIIVVSFPWARHRARHTLMFEDQVTWLANHASRSAVEGLMRIAWRTVGAIVSWVVADAHHRKDPLYGLRRIGIDEISYKVQIERQRQVTAANAGFAHLWGVPCPLTCVKGRCEPPLRYGSRSACGRPLTPAPGMARAGQEAHDSSSDQTD